MHLLLMIFSTYKGFIGMVWLEHSYYLKGSKNHRKFLKDYDVDFE